MSLEVPSVPSLRQGQSYLRKENNRNLLAYPKDTGIAWQHFLRAAQHPQEPGQTQLSLSEPSPRSCSCPMEHQKLHTADQSKWDPKGEAGQALPKENVRKNQA